MCLIIAKIKDNELPTKEMLENGDKHNNDGIGLAFWKKDTHEVKIKKDFPNIGEFLTWFYENVKKEDACIIHFRLATHGLKDEGNRHPFPITKNGELLRKTELVCSLAVAHNGVLGDYPPHNVYSDTQKFIMDILAQEEIKTNLKSPTIRKLITNFIGRDKLSILDGEGNIILLGEFNEEGGLYFSNYSYRVRKYNNYEYIGSGFGLQRYISEKINSVNNKSFLALEDKTIESYESICDGCGKKKFVKYVEIDDEPYYLCKSCRKKVNKGKLELRTQLEKSILDTQCDSCNDWFKLSDINIKHGIKLCNACMMEMNQIS